MPGQLPNFIPGQPAFPTLNADVLNTMVRGIRGIPNQRPKTNVPDKISKSTVECLVINNTSASYDTHSILAINSSASAGLTVATAQEKLNFQDEPVFTVNVPAASTDFPFVLLEPLKASGGIARAAVGGFAVCTVNITDTAHEYANPVPGDHTRMESTDTGQARIIHKPSGTGDKTCVVYLVEPKGTGAGDDLIADHVHVVGNGGSGAITCRRVTLSDPDAWPPVESSPVVEYENVWESENREPRIVDSPGTATHIIPLYKDRDGNYYIQFWKTNTYADIETLTSLDLDIVQNEDCSFTVTPDYTFTTKRISLTVTTPGTAGTGLTLTVGDAP